ncbi:MAG: UDP-N-acetylglucosamine--N-acetylmuramyl-(pentapeptide) pyrophosphoryl-undecaprenol N-acetylglucosamine transferase [Lentimonas sp.]|jgi:UDP-N-acetylglucosamine--N-acetylmuramyl-(pentapeptide) pyrophosphoryl-undecaprenol N-acetylglucosamine transferase
MSRILIACGGTGGHLAPGIAIAEVLQSRGHDCTLLISQKQVDSALIEKYSHLNFYKTPGQAFSGGVTRWITSCWSLLSGYLFSSKLVKTEQPDLVLLFGGFLSVGLGLAARCAGVPVAVHEANCRPGKAVRLLKHLATRVYLPDGVRLKGLPSRRVRYLGYPVRGDVKHCLKSDCWERLEISVTNKLLVLIGGSQGAAALNEWVVEHFEALAKLGISVYCVTGLGKNSASSVQRTSSTEETVSATFVPFSDQMGDVISAADLVISRAGAGSIAEIIRCRAPSILIPYPFAADDHQQANALMHERHGAGMVLVQDDLDQLLGEIKNLIFNDWMLSKFKSNIERLDRFDSGERIATDIEGLCTARALAESDKLEPAV